MTERKDAGMGLFTDALRTVLDADIDAAGLDAADVAGGANAETTAIHQGGDVIELVPPTSSSDAGLDAFTSALRDRLDHQVRSRELAGIPPLRPPARRSRTAIAAITAVAAIALLGLGVVGVMSMRAAATSGGSPGGEPTAFVDAATGAGSHDVRSAETARARAVPSPHTDGAPDVADDASTDEIVGVDPDGDADTPGDDPGLRAGDGTGSESEPVAPTTDEPSDDPSEPEGAASTTTRLGPTAVASEAHSSVRSSTTTLRGRSLDELERDARSAWRAGELSRAARLFREVIGRAGRSARAELAYGDLFLVLQTARDARGLARARADYLRRFPDGRLAEDVRAARCTTRRGDDARTCWAEYLEHHPSGSHRDEAFRALGERDD